MKSNGIYLFKRFEQGLESMNDHVRYKEGIAFLEGESGAGKSTLLLNVKNAIDSSQIQICYLSSGSLTRSGMHRILLNEVGLPLSRTTVENARVLAGALMNRTRRLSVWIDEVHMLPPETIHEIRILSETTLNATPLFDVILCGLPCFKESLRQPIMAPLRRRINTHVELRGMNSEEVRPFAAHIMGPCAKNLSDEALTMIFEHTRGLPGLMSHLLKALNKKYDDQDITVERVVEWLEMHNY